MVISTGTVRRGVIELDSDPLPEGATVTVLMTEGDETFELSSAEEAALNSAILEAEKGEAVPAAELLARLRRS